MTIHTKHPLDPKALASTFIDAAWSSDFDQLDRLCSPTVFVHDPANPTAGIGPEAHKQFVERITEGAIDVDVAVDYAIVGDGKVAVHTSGVLTGDNASRDQDGAEEVTSISGFEVMHLDADLIVEWSGTVLPNRAVKELRTSLAGNVICPDDAEYDEARAVWNGMIDRYPGLILRCAGVSDVIKAVNFIRENDLLVSIRGGGHNVAGSAVCDGGVVIDLSAMTGVWVDPDTRTAWVQAGATLRDVDRETQAFGLATPLGVVSATGVSGLTLGGGLGHLRNKYGLSADNIESVGFVSITGEYLTASADQHQDLFWSIRGSGTSPGVVTGFEFDLHPVGPEVSVALVIYHSDDAIEVMRGVREYARSSPDELSFIASLGLLPDDELFTEDVVDDLKIVIGGMYAGSPEEGEPVIEPLRELAEPIVDFSGTMRYVDFQQAFDADYPDGRRYYWKSLYLESLSEDVIDRIIEWGNMAPSPHSTADLWTLGGAVADVGLDDSAFPGRDSPYLLAVEANWDDPEADETNIEWVRDFLEDMSPFSDSTVNFNFPGFHEGGDETMKRGLDDAYQRLVETKTAYDPENRLRVNQTVEQITKEEMP